MATGFDVSTPTLGVDVFLTLVDTSREWIIRSKYYPLLLDNSTLIYKSDIEIAHNNIL